MISFREYHKQMEILNEKVEEIQKADISKETDLNKLKEYIKELDAQIDYADQSENNDLATEYIGLKKKINKRIKELSQQPEDSQGQVENSHEQSTWTEISNFYKKLSRNPESSSSESVIFKKGGALDVPKSAPDGSDPAEELKKTLEGGLKAINLSYAYTSWFDTFNKHNDAKTALCLIFAIMVSVASKKLNQKRIIFNNKTYNIEKNGDFVKITGNDGGTQTGVVGAINACSKTIFLGHRLNINDSLSSSLDSNPKTNNLDAKSVRQIIYKLSELINSDRLGSILTIPTSPNSNEDHLSFNKDDYEKRDGKWVNKKTNELADKETAEKLDAVESLSHQGNVNRNPGEQEQDETEGSKDKSNDEDEEDKVAREKIMSKYNSSKDDPLDVVSLSTDSDSRAIEVAIEGTFGPDGKIFRTAMKKAKDAMQKIQGRADEDSKRFGAKKREDELNESIIFKELSSNPLLKEQKEIIEEKFNIRGLGRFNVKSNGAKSSWEQETGDSGSLEKYRNSMHQKAKDVVSKYHLDQKYVSLADKNEGISKIKKLASDYAYGLITRVDNLIKKNDYNGLGRFIRDMKADKADRRDRKNEAYAQSKKGQIREADEKKLVDGLNKLDPAKLNDEAKYFLAACAYSNYFSLDRKLNDSKDTEMEKLTDWFHKNVSDTWLPEYFKHTGRLIRENEKLKPVADSAIAKVREVEKQLDKEGIDRTQGNTNQNGKDNTNQNGKDNANQDNTTNVVTDKDTRDKLMASAEKVKSSNNPVEILRFISEVEKAKFNNSDPGTNRKHIIFKLLGVSDPNSEIKKVANLDGSKSKLALDKINEKLGFDFKFVGDQNDTSNSDTPKDESIGQKLNKNDESAKENMLNSLTPKDKEYYKKQQMNYLGSFLQQTLQFPPQNIPLKTIPGATNKSQQFRGAVSVVTEEFILSEDGTPISKSGAEIAILKALSSTAQEAAEGKQWIIDNIYKGNPMASKIVDQFVAENRKKAPQAAKVLATKQQPVQQANAESQPTAPAGTPQQVATAIQNTSQPINSPAINNTNQPVNNQQAPQQPDPQQSKPVNATVTTAAADGFPNRLYKKIIRRKIGM